MFSSQNIKRLDFRLQTLLLHGANSHRLNDADRFIVQNDGVVDGGEFNGARGAVIMEAFSHEGVHDSGYLARWGWSGRRCCHATFLRGLPEIL